MPYKRILEELLAALPGARAAVLLDPHGEVVVAAGEKDPNHLLVGAYQGITLSRVRKISDDYPVGEIGHLASRYAGGKIVSRPLKDGYFVVLALSPDANLPLGVDRLERAARLVNEEL